MAILRSSPFISTNPAKHKSVYDVEVSGYWNIHNGRRGRARRAYTNVFLIVWSVLLITCTFSLYREFSPVSFSNELMERIKLLEARVTFFENTINSPRTEDKLERRKRSVEPSNAEENRGKKRNKSNRTKHIDIRAVQFSPSNPGLFTMRPGKGVIGPWNEVPSNSHKMDSFGMKMTDSNRKFEMSRAGTYLIYAQVTSTPENNTNTYSINVISADDKRITPISVCSSPGKLFSFNEVSCYTSSIRSLKPGDIVYLQQLEHSKNINMESSNTYFGVIFLSG